MNRKAVVAFLLLVLLTSMLSSALVGTLKVAKADDPNSGSNGDPNAWPMLGGDSGHSGYSTSTAPLTNKTLWYQNMPYETTLGAEPSVANGVLYLGSESGSAYALNASTGNQIWSYNTGYRYAQTTTAIAGNTVYVCSGYSVFALDANSGKELWNFTSGTGDFGSSVEGCSPSVSNGIVYACFANPSAYLHSYTNVSALVENDGLFAINASMGALIWHYKGEFESPPAIVHGIVYTYNVSSVLALDSSNGNLIWQDKTYDLMENPIQEMTSPIVVVNGVVYVCMYRGFVFGLDALTGNKVWSYCVPGYAPALAVAGNTIYISVNSGFTYPTDTLYPFTALYAINGSSGNELWDVQMNDSWFSPPVISDGVVFVGRMSTTSSYPFRPTGFLDAFNASDGTKIWSYQTLTSDLYSPAPIVADGVAYLTQEYYIYAISQLGRERTQTTVFCAPNLTTANSPVTCAALVFGTNLTGTVTWSSSTSTGNFNSTQTTVVDLADYFGDGFFASGVAGVSIVTYTDDSFGEIEITASYSGDSNNGQSTDNTILTLNSGKITSLLVNDLGQSSDVQNSTTILCGDSYAFNASTQDSLGGWWDITSQVNWSISSGAGGFWSGNIYSSANVGNWTVTATCQGLQATAQLQVLDAAGAPLLSFVQSGTENTNISVENGTQFNVDLRIDNGSNINGWSVDINWNPSNLILLDINEGPYLQHAGTNTLFVFPEIDNTLGTVLGDINDFNIDDFSANGSGVLATLTFQAVGTGNSTLTVNSEDSELSEIANGNTVPVQFAVSNGAVSVSAPSQLPPIDFNNDGKANFADIQYFVSAYIRYCNGGAMDPACDLNHDGKLNFADIQLFVHDYIAYAQATAK